MNNQSLVYPLLFDRACREKADIWLPACGETETEFTKNGQTYLYCYNPALGQHAYYNVTQDRVLSADEAMAVML